MFLPGPSFSSVRSPALCKCSECLESYNVWKVQMCKGGILLFSELFESLDKWLLRTKEVLAVGLRWKWYYLNHQSFQTGGIKSRWTSTCQNFATLQSRGGRTSWPLIKGLQSSIWIERAADSAILQCQRLHQKWWM